MIPRSLLALCSAGLVGFTTAATPPYFEDFESYNVSGGAQPLAAQSGWTSEYEPNLFVVTLNSIDGASLRHVQDGNFTEGISGYDAISPRFGPDFGRVDMDVVIRGASNGAFANEYHIALLDTETQHFCARIVLQPDILIRVGTIPLTRVSKFTLTALPGIVTPAAGETFQFGVAIAPSGAMRLYLNDLLVFEGVESNRALFGRTGRIGRLAIWTMNDHLGDVDGSSYSLTLDNIRSTPLACPTDLDADGAVGPADISTVLGSWTGCDSPNAVCAGDVNGDGRVNAADLASVLGAWGPCQ